MEGKALVCHLQVEDVSGRSRGSQLFLVVWKTKDTKWIYYIFLKGNFQSEDDDCVQMARERISKQEFSSQLHKCITGLDEVNSELKYFKFCEI